MNCVVIGLLIGERPGNRVTGPVTHLVTSHNVKVGSNPPELFRL